MKKTIACMIVLSFLFGLPIAFAENEGVTLRNGIVIGDSIEMVKEKEPIKFIEESESMLKTENTVLLDIPDSNIVYSFVNNELYAINYMFREMPKGDISAVQFLCVSEYTNVEDALTAKYGDAIQENDKYSSLKTEIHESFNKVYGSMQLVKIINKSAMVIDNITNERVLKANDGIIKIDHFLMQIDDLFIHSLSFQHFSNTDITEKIGTDDKVTNEI